MKRGEWDRNLPPFGPESFAAYPKDQKVSIFVPIGTVINKSYLVM